LEFYINGEVWDEYSDEIPVHMRFIIPDNSGVIKRIDYNSPKDARETEINIGHSTALKFLKAVVHQLNAPFWSKDLSNAHHDYDPCLAIYPEHRPDYGISQDCEHEENFDCALYVDDDDSDGSHNNKTDDENNKSITQDISTDNREPMWSLRLLLTKGIGEKIQTFYNQMHDESQELF